MAVPFDTPVSAIEGIGPSVEKLFQPEGVYDVYDLLRATTPALHSVATTMPASNGKFRSPSNVPTATAASS